MTHDDPKPGDLFVRPTSDRASGAFIAVLVLLDMTIYVNRKNMGPQRHTDPTMLEFILHSARSDDNGWVKVPAR